MDSVVLGGGGRKICHSHGSQTMLPPPSRAHTPSTIVLKYARGPDLSGTTQGMSFSPDRRNHAPSFLSGPVGLASVRIDAQEHWWHEGKKG